MDQEGGQKPSDGQSSEMSALVRRLFDSCDTTHRGRISLDEFRPVAQQMAAAGGMEGDEEEVVPLTEEGLQEMFRTLGPDQDGFLLYDAFALGMSASIRQRSEEIFEAFDSDDDGVLNFEELREALKYLGDEESVPDDAVRALLARHDTAGVGGLNRPSFLTVFVDLATMYEHEVSTGGAEAPTPATPIQTQPAGGEPLMPDTPLFKPEVPQSPMLASPLATPSQGRRRPHRRQRSFVLVHHALDSPDAAVLKSSRDAVPAATPLRAKGYVLEYDESAVAPALAAKGLKEDEVAELKRAFNECDLRKVGELGLDELKYAFPDHDPGLVMALLDRNWSGGIEFIEFALAMAELRKFGLVSGVPLQPRKSLRIAVGEPTREPNRRMLRSNSIDEMEIQMRVETLELSLVKAHDTQRELEKSFLQEVNKGAKLRAELQSEGSRCEELEREVHELHDALRVERDSFDELRSSYKRLEDALYAPEAFQKGTPSDAGKTRKTQDAVASLMKKLRSMEHDNDSLRGQLEQKSTELESEKSRARDMEQRLSAEIEICRKVATRSRQVVLDQADAGKSAAQSGSSFEDELSAAVGEQAIILTAQLENARKHTAELEQEVSLLRAQHSHSAEEISRVKREYEDTIQTLRTELAAERERQQKAAPVSQEKEGAIEDLRRRVETLELALSESRDAVKALTDEKQRSDDRAAHLEASIRRDRERRAIEAARTAATEIVSALGLFRGAGNVGANSAATSADVLCDVAKVVSSTKQYISRASTAAEDDQGAISAARGLTIAISSLLADVKGVAITCPEPAVRQPLVSSSLLVAEAACKAMETQGTEGDAAVRSAADAVREALEKVDSCETPIPDASIDDAAQSELLAAARQIESLARQLRESRAKRQEASPARPNRAPGDLSVDDAIIEAALAISQATAALVTAAAAAQKERVTRGRAGATVSKPYLPNPVWAEGLASAGRAVAGATGELVGAANKVAQQGCRGEELLDETLAASAHAVAAATAQLVSATRSKSDGPSETQEKVDEAARSVTRATALLVDAARAAGQQAAAAKQQQAEEEEARKAASLGAAALRAREMEQQVQILRLEKELAAARGRLYSLRKSAYGK